MKILMICGVYAEENENEVLECTKGYAEQSANIFQRKLISGIEKNQVEYKIISAPLIGAYPMRYKNSRFSGFTKTNSNYEYVCFNNIWGIRNLSRSKSLKKAVKEYLTKETEEEFLILVYCPHTPFLEAAIYAKEFKPKSKVCLVVPDLPQYMNLNKSKRGIYDICKKIDIRHMEKFIAKVDSFVLLTEPMKDVLCVGDRPYMVVEGIVDVDSYKPKTINAASDGMTRIVYAGKMNMKFGIKDLVDSFMRIEDSNYRLILCGDGDARAYVEEKAVIDKRIEYKGMVTATKAREYIDMANVLVNPRPNNDEYTKYSFPSKNIEYLLTGKPVVAYMLDGMPNIYSKFIYVIKLGNGETFEKTLIEASKRERQSPSFHEYAKEHLQASKIVNEIINMYS